MAGFGEGEGYAPGLPPTGSLLSKPLFEYNLACMLSPVSLKGSHNKPDFVVKTHPILITASK